MRWFQDRVALGVRTGSGCLRGATVVVLVVAGCGGQQATRPAPASAEPSVASSAPSASPSAAASGPATTTTTALTDGDAGAATKLPETRERGSSADGAAAPSKGAHTHDPGRGPDDIRVLIAARREEARACYDKALKDHPDLEGDLVIKWTIDPKGAVTHASLDTSRSTITEPAVVDCVSAVIRKIQFAASPGGFETAAFYPFNFHPHRAKPSQ